MHNRIDGTALITGGSAGIGAAFARVFAERGHDVVLVARRRDALEAIAGQLEARHGIRAHVFPADLADPATAERLFEAVRNAGIDVSILVNNAGFGVGGPFVETNLERELELIQVNVTSLVQLTKHFLRPMVHRGRGGIINVASMAGFQPGPLASMYYASKAFVISFSEAIAEELRDTGVVVSALCPGPVQTEFAAVAGVGPTSLARLGVADARTVAEFGYGALQRGVRIAIPGAQNKFLNQLRRITPRIAATKFVRYLQETRGKAATSIRE